MSTGETSIQPTGGAAGDNSQFELRQQMYERHCNHLWELRAKNYENSDNLILTLSGALLGVSIAFVKDVVPIARLVALPCLIISWTLFGSAILAVLFSFFYGRRAIDEQIQDAEDYYINGNDDCLNKESVWAKRTERCNRISTFCFTLGVATTIYFVAVNLHQERNYAHKAAKQQQTRARNPVRGGGNRPQNAKDTR